MTEAVEVVADDLNKKRSAAAAAGTSSCD